MDKLSIIIINYHSKDFLRDCLISLTQSGEVPKSWEIIVVDNHSADEDQMFVKQLPSQFPLLRIKTIINIENKGFGKANNEAIKQTAGDYILFLNPDTIVSVAAIQTVLDYLINHSDVAAATPRVVLKSGELDDASHRGFPTPWNAFCHFAGLGKLLPNSTFFNGYHLGYQQMDKIHDIDACAGAFMMVRRTVGDKLRWFDEDYFWYGEDLDLCYRIKQMGGRIVYMPTATITHHKGVTSGIKNHSKNISTASGETTKRAQDARFAVMEIFYRKHYQNKYPALVRWMVLIGIKILKKLMI